jgi:DNA-binding NtrC family response regulator
LRQRRGEPQSQILAKPPRLAAAVHYSFPRRDGPFINVRELENVVERAMIQRCDGLLRFDHLEPQRGQRLQGYEEKESGPEKPRWLTLDEVASRHIRQSLEKAEGKINGPAGTAERLGMHPNTLRKRMDKLGIPYVQGRAYGPRH